MITLVIIAHFFFELKNSKLYLCRLTHSGSP